MKYQQAIKTNPKRATQSSARPMLSRCSPIHPLLQLQQTIGNRAVSRFLQAKLKVNKPGDVYEQEADRVAEAVMRMPGPPISRAREWEQGRQGEAETATLQRKCAACASGQGLCPKCAEEERMQRKPLAAQITPLVQRQVMEEPDEEDETLQTKKAPAASCSLEGEESVPPIVYEVLRSPGQPLDQATRAFFEPRFGYDFSHVRVHTDTPATESAAAIKARAFTVGSDIAFGAGEYAPQSAAGQKLLAHELTHVIQQDGQMATLRSKGIDIQKTGRPMVQGGFFGSLWKGIKKVGKAIGKGAKAVGRWGWNVLKAGGAWVWDLFTKAPLRLWRIIEHLGSGVVGIVKWLWHGIKTVRGIKSFAQWIWNGFLSGAAWVGRLITKLLDVIGISEIMDLLWQIIKFNTRTLSSTEIAEAKKVFGSSISYWQVRIDEYSLIAWIGSLFSGGGGMGVTTFHTINFNHKIKTAPGNSDMAWLIHELTHVSQYEHVGSQYMGEALHAQATGGYGYGGEAGLLTAFAAGKHLRDFNREQQGDIARDFYLALTSGRPTTAYDPFIVELRAGKL
jgi:hypothetical protein